MRHTLDPESDTWASLVRRHRERLQMTQKQLADLVGVTRESVGRWENGKFKPEMDVAIAAIKALGMDREIGLRAAGFVPADTEAEPELWTYARTLGLDPRSPVVQRILNGRWDEGMQRRMLRQEREWQEADQRRRLEQVELAEEMYARNAEDAGGANSAA